MKFSFDHDLHIHSHLSLCSGDPEQNNENILKYALDNNLKYICLTDHFWDDGIPCASQWYRDQASLAITTGGRSSLYVRVRNRNG